MADPKLVRVEWVDITELGGDTWKPIKKIKPKADRCTSVGWLIAESDEIVALAQGYSKGHVFGVWTYPRGCIISITPIER